MSVKCAICNCNDFVITGVSREKNKAPSLLSLCLGVVGKHLEDIVADLAEISVTFPSDIKVLFNFPSKLVITAFLIFLKRV